MDMDFVALVVREVSAYIGGVRCGWCVCWDMVATVGSSVFWLWDRFLVSFLMRCVGDRTCGGFAVGAIVIAVGAIVTRMV